MKTKHLTKLLIFQFLLLLAIGVYATDNEDSNSSFSDTESDSSTSDGSDFDSDEEDSSSSTSDYEGEATNVEDDLKRKTVARKRAIRTRSRRTASRRRLRYRRRTSTARTVPTAGHARASSSRSPVSARGTTIVRRTSTARTVPTAGHARASSSRTPVSARGTTIVLPKAMRERWNPNEVPVPEGGCGDPPVYTHETVEGNHVVKCCMIDTIAVCVRCTTTEPPVCRPPHAYSHDSCMTPTNYEIVERVNDVDMDEDEWGWLSWLFSWFC